MTQKLILALTVLIPSALAHANPCPNNYCGDGSFVAVQVAPKNFEEFVSKVKSFEITTAGGERLTCDKLVGIRARAVTSTLGFKHKIWITVSPEALPIDVKTGMAQFFLTGGRSVASDQCIAGLATSGQISIATFGKPLGALASQE